MRKLAFTLFIFATLICQTLGTQIGLTDKEKEASANDWGTLTYNTQISIGVDSDTNALKTNQDAQLLVRIKNLSTNEEYGVYVQNAFLSTPGLSFTILSPSGKDVSPVFYKAFRGSGGNVWVHPNQINGFGFSIHEICKMDEVGTYKIILKMKRWTPDRRKSFEIVSNPLFVTVVPGQ
jgi:hypothetical protein